MRWTRPIALLLSCTHVTILLGVQACRAMEPKLPPDLSRSLSQVSQALITAGDLTSDMASKLPNWYSSKEGLTGESPAVFGGCGMSLTQAGKSLQGYDQESDSLKFKFQGCASDLASAACALDPIGIADDMDRACGALEDLVRFSGRENDSGQAIQQFQSEFVEALKSCGGSFHEYGDLLSNEDTNQGESSAGRVLSRAGTELNRAAQAFAHIQYAEMAQALLEAERCDSTARGLLLGRRAQHSSLA